MCCCSRANQPQQCVVPASPTALHSPDKALHWLLLDRPRRKLENNPNAPNRALLGNNSATPGIMCSDIIFNPISL
ncbi:hypothetical protein EYF80_039579 [Liparis tanakae]|uniref:Uncharacterized protein n=1 Tax=Liparis tanakae TaxID=230148 RepID=A0A4Z2G9I8_9TELE|nr:hypothetical protein EYF80_039579 [Liparis tanakae]